MHDNDPLQAHLRDELGHSATSAARPLQASVASAISFLTGGLVPFLGLFAPSANTRIGLIVVVTMCGLGAAGVLGARAAGVGVLRPALRVLIGGGLAMAVTAAVGQLAQVSGI